MDNNNPYQAPQSDINVAGAEEYQPQPLSFGGRIGRARYFAYLMGSYLVAIVLVGIAVGIGSVLNMGSDSGLMIGILVLLVYIPMIIAAFTYAVRRLNDLDKSGWLSLLFLVPLVNLIITLYIMFGRGTQGANRFGPPPNKNPVGVLILAWIFPVIAILGIVAAIALPAYQQYIERAAGG